jgi:lysophospholipase L1-like esterase
VLPPGPAATPAARAPGTGPGTTVPAPTGTADPAATDPGAPGTTTAGSAPASSVDPASPPVDPTAPDPGASTTVAPGPPKRITAIGDSVMLGAAPALQSGLNGSVFVDARVGRQVSECLQILQGWHDKGLLGDVVVVHIGNNGTFNADQFAQMRELLKDVPKVIFVNNKVPRGWEEGNNQVIADGVAGMPNAALLNWKNESGEHPDWFWSDGMHLRPEGAAAYTNFINSLM